MKYFVPVIGTETYLHKEFISICMPYKRLNWRFFFVLADVKQIYRVICKAMFTYILLIEIISLTVLRRSNIVNFRNTFATCIKLRS